MILNVSISNYRSFKEEVEFTLVAESSRIKEKNVSTRKLVNFKDEIRVLKTALIYGANASGKTTLLKCLFEIRSLIKDNDLDISDPIPYYSPFLFNTESRVKPCCFKIEFIGKDDIKYAYELEFNSNEIVLESLSYYPKGRKKNLFERISNKSKIHKFKFKNNKVNKNVEVFKNQTALSKFGKDIPDEIISEVFIYMTSIEVVNACSSRKISSLKKEVSELFAKNDDIRNKMNQLLLFADTGINSLQIKEVDKDSFEFPENMSDSLKTKIFEGFKYDISSVHDLYDSNEKVGTDLLPFKEASHGTKTLYSLGGKILESLELGSTLFIDELETGLHPFLSKLLVSIFQNEKINTKNSQLIFTTHDTTLLDRTIFRKDQIWFAEKNEKGESDLYSLQDFSDVREDTPFDKWYLAGKFGGVPNIKSLERLFIDEKI